MEVRVPGGLGNGVGMVRPEKGPLFGVGCKRA